MLAPHALGRRCEVVYTRIQWQSLCPRCAFIVLLIKIKAPAAIYWHSWASVCVCVCTVGPCTCHSKACFTMQLPFRNGGWHFTHMLCGSISVTTLRDQPEAPAIEAPRRLLQLKGLKTTSKHPLVFVCLTCSQSVNTCFRCVTKRARTNPQHDWYMLWYWLHAISDFLFWTISAAVQ